MAKLLKLRRGTTTQHGSFTGAEGELTIDTTKDTAVVHDGSQAGGRPLLREDLSNLPAGTIDNADVNASAAIAGTKISPNFGSQNITTTGTIGSNDITITNTTPSIDLVDSDNDSDFKIQNANGLFLVYDTTNSASRLSIASDGTLDVNGNLDANQGVDVTGNITVTGTVDGVDLQTLNTAVSANTAKVTNATHTGDVTGATALTIANNAVTAAKIANGNVTNDKLAPDIPANKLEVNDAHIIIGDASADGTLQTLSGDVTMTRTDAVTIADAIALKCSKGFTLTRKIKIRGKTINR